MTYTHPRGIWLLCGLLVSVGILSLFNFSPAGILLLALGAGLFFLKRWARSLTLIISLFFILWLLYYLIVILADSATRMAGLYAGNYPMTAGYVFGQALIGSLIIFFILALIFFICLYFASEKARRAFGLEKPPASSRFFKRLINYLDPDSFLIALMGQTAYILYKLNKADYHGPPRFISPVVSTKVRSNRPVDTVNKFPSVTGRIFFWAIYQNFDPGDDLHLSWISGDTVVTTSTKKTGNRTGITFGEFTRPDTGWPAGFHKIRIEGKTRSAEAGFEIIKGPVERTLFNAPGPDKMPGPDLFSYISKQLLILVTLALALGIFISPVMAADTSGNTALLWKSETRAPVTSTAVSADGQYVVVGSSTPGTYYLQENISMFNRDGKLLWGYQTGHSIESVAISTDGQYSAAGSEKSVYLFNRNGKVLWEYETSLTIQGVAISGDGQYVSAGGSGNGAFLFDRDGKLIWNNKPGNMGYDTVMSADGQYILSSGQDGLYMYSRDGKLLWKYDTGGYMRSIALSANGQYAAAGSESGIHLLNREGKLIWKYKTTNEPWKISMSDDGQYIAIASSFESLLFNHSSLLWKSKGFSQSVAISADGQYIAIGGSDYTSKSTRYSVYLLNREGTVLSKSPVQGSVKSLSMSDDGQYVAAGCEDNYIYYLKNPMTGSGIQESGLLVTQAQEKITSTVGNIPVDLPVLVLILSLLSIGGVSGIYRISNKSSGVLSFPAQKPVFITADLEPADQFVRQPVTWENLPQELLERYTESELIRKDEFSQVFKARRKDGWHVAIRIPIMPDEKTGQSFITQLQNWTKLDHTNIVKVYDFNIMPVPFFEMELCDGSLSDIKKPVDSKEAALLMFNICEGLKYAHQRKIVHSDLRSEVILLKNGIVKISDWGLSRVLSDSVSTTAASFNPYYAAPEQISNREKDERTDIWQLGVIFYEMVTGVLPFIGDSMVEIVAAIATKDPAPPSLINPPAGDTEPLIRRCLEKEPAKRYQSVQDLQEDLARYLRINYTESLKKSVNVNDKTQSAVYCGELVLITMLTGDIAPAYKYVSDLALYSEGETRQLTLELAGQLKTRLEYGLFEIPDELVKKAEFIVHKAKQKNRDT